MLSLTLAHYSNAAIHFLQPYFHAVPYLTYLASHSLLSWTLFPQSSEAKCYPDPFPFSFPLYLFEDGMKLCSKCTLSSVFSCQWKHLKQGKDLIAYCIEPYTLSSINKGKADWNKVNAWMKSKQCNKSSRSSPKKQSPNMKRPSMKDDLPLISR